MVDPPAKREKTNSKKYEQTQQEITPKLQDPKEDPNVDWEKLKKKGADSKDPSKIVLGTGKRTGIVFKTC